MDISISSKTRSWIGGNDFLLDQVILNLEQPSKNVLQWKLLLMWVAVLRGQM